MPQQNCECDVGMDKAGLTPGNDIAVWTTVDHRGKHTDIVKV